MVTQIGENQRQKRNPEISHRLTETSYLEIKTLETHKECFSWDSELGGKKKLGEFVYELEK